MWSTGGMILSLLRTSPVIFITEKTQLRLYILQAPTPQFFANLPCDILYTFVRDKINTSLRPGDIY
jgi:hypothetical protein